MKMDPEDRNESAGTQRRPMEPQQEFLLAIARMYWPTVKKLIEAGKVSIHEDDDYALRTAVEREQKDMTRWLLEHGADPNAKNGEALYEAARNKDAKTMRLLVEHGARIGPVRDRMLRLDREDLAKLLTAQTSDIIEKREDTRREETRRHLQRRNTPRLR